MRAGYTVFVISTRNNVASVTHLLAKTGTRILFTGHDDAIRQLAQQSIDELGDAGKGFQTHLMPVYDDFYTKSLYSHDASTLPSKLDRNTQAIIMHSSGTSMLPKFACPFSCLNIRIHLHLDRLNQPPETRPMDTQRILQEHVRPL